MTMGLGVFLNQAKGIVTTPLDPLRKGVLAVGGGLFIALVAQASFTKVVLISTTYYFALPIFKKLTLHFQYYVSSRQKFVFSFISSGFALFLLSRWANVGSVAILTLGLGSIVYHRYLFPVINQRIGQQQDEPFLSDIKSLDFVRLRDMNKGYLQKQLLPLSLFDSFSNHERKRLVQFYLSIPPKTLKSLLCGNQDTFAKQSRLVLALSNQDQNNLLEFLRLDSSFPFSLAECASQSMVIQSINNREVVRKFFICLTSYAERLSALPFDVQKVVLNQLFAIISEISKIRNIDSRQNLESDISNAIEFVLLLPKPFEEQHFRWALDVTFSGMMVEYVIAQLKMVEEDEVKRSYFLALDCILSLMPSYLPDDRKHDRLIHNFDQEVCRNWINLPLPLEIRQKQVTMLKAFSSTSIKYPIEYYLPVVVRHSRAIQKVVSPAESVNNAIFSDTTEIEETLLFKVAKLDKQLQGSCCFLDEHYEKIESAIIRFPGLNEIVDHFFVENGHFFLNFSNPAIFPFLCHLAQYCAGQTEPEKAVATLIEEYRNQTGQKTLDNLPQFLSEKMNKTNQE